MRKRSGPVGGKNRIPAGGFGVTRVTAMEDPPAPERRKCSSRRGWGVKRRVAGLI